MCGGSYNRTGAAGVLTTARPLLRSGVCERSRPGLFQAGTGRRVDTLSGSGRLRCMALWLSRVSREEQWESTRQVVFHCMDRRSSPEKRGRTS